MASETLKSRKEKEIRACRSGNSQMENKHML